MAVKEWSTTAADNDDADATINWLEGQSPATVNDSARAMMAAIASWYALIDGGTISGGTVGGTADAITLTNSPTVSALAAGQRYLFKYTSSGNTGAVTLNVDGLGNTALRYKDVALVSGDIATNDWVLAVHDGTRFQMLNPPRLSWATTDIPTDTSGGAVADLFLFLDASQSNALNAVTVQKLLDNAMTGLTADTTPDVADSLLTYDASANAAKTTTITNFYKTINTLTVDASPDGAADYFPIYDATAAAPRKVILSSFAATEAQQETGSLTSVFVTPLRQHFHQSAAKMWINLSNVAADLGSYNVSGTTDSGVGQYTVTIATDFTSGDYVAVRADERTSNDSIAGTRTHAAGSLIVISVISDGTSNETGFVSGSVAAFGVV
jgi:hypothetical protein